MSGTLNYTKHKTIPKYCVSAAAAGAEATNEVQYVTEHLSDGEKGCQVKSEKSSQPEAFSHRGCT